MMLIKATGVKKTNKQKERIARKFYISEITSAEASAKTSDKINSSNTASRLVQNV